MAAQTKEEFARLLSEGVYRIKLHETKSLQIIQDQLGYAIGREGGSSVDYWRRGHVPSKLEDLENLAREIVRRGRLGRNWLEQFLIHGRHPAPDQLADELFSSDAVQTAVSAANQRPNNLPGKNYRELVGRDSLVEQIWEALRDKNGRWLVGIDGQGGIGKTVLARDIAERCQEMCYFETIIWISASCSDLPGATIPEGGLTFERLLDEIATQMGVHDVAKMKLAPKEQRIRDMLYNRPVLLVLDNLETAVTPQEEIIERLRPFLNPSKALLTSRHRFRGDLYAIHLDGLIGDGAVKFIHQDAAEKGIQHVATARLEELTPIIDITGGSPLALKLIISQLQRFALPVIMQNLTEVVAQPNGETEYTRFYRHVYGRSWSLLSENSQRLLLAMSNFAPGLGGNFEAIQQISALPYPDLISSVDALWQYSFLEVGEKSALHQIRYYLHPLTQYFVLSDIMKLL